MRLTEMSFEHFGGAIGRIDGSDQVVKTHVQSHDLSLFAHCRETHSMDFIIRLQTQRPRTSLQAGACGCAC
jgi:hypothetical protein